MIVVTPRRPGGNFCGGVIPSSYVMRQRMKSVVGTAAQSVNLLTIRGGAPG